MRRRVQAGSFVRRFGHHSVWERVAGKLHVDTAEFDLSFHGASIDAGVHNRVYIRHCKVTGDAVLRIQAMNVSRRDFLDEWISRPWGEASLWSSTADSTNLRKMHEQLRALRESLTCFFSYESAPLCSDPSDRYEISLSYGENQSSYFQLEIAPTSL